MVRGRIGIVGASLAGLNAAIEIRRRGYSGELVIMGDEPCRPYDRPPLSKELLRGEWPEAEADLRFDDSELAADWRLGVRATSLDCELLQVTLDDGSVECFDGGIVIATGASPRLLPGTDLAGVHLLRTMADMRALRDDVARGPCSVIVVGGGFIGQEVAASCRRLGHKVVMLEAAAPAEHVVGRELAGELAEIHRAEGVDVRLGVSVAALEGEERLTGVRLSDGETLAADVAVVGVGVAPNVDWLQDSGLTIDNGVVCDETCLAAPSIVAAGDVARWPNHRYGELRRVEHWDNAIRQAVHAARRLLAQPGEPEHSAPYQPVPWFWSDQYGWKLQLVGSPVHYDEVRVVRLSDDPKRLLALFRRGDRLNAVFGLNAAKRVLEFRRRLEGEVPWDEGLATVGLAQGAPA